MAAALLALGAGLVTIALGLLPLEVGVAHRASPAEPLGRVTLSLYSVRFLEIRLDALVVATGAGGGPHPPARREGAGPSRGARRRQWLLRLALGLAYRAATGRPPPPPQRGGLALALPALLAVARLLLADCRRLRWTARIGLPEAGSTALTAGVLRAAAGCLAAVLRQQLSMARPPEVRVEPEFRGGVARWSTEFTGIFRIRVGYVMLRSFGNLLRSVGAGG